MQCREVREMEAIGARHTALAAVLQAFSVRIVRLSAHLWKAPILVYCQECGGCLSGVIWWDECSSRRAETVLSEKGVLNTLGLIRREVCARTACHAGSRSFNPLGGSAVCYGVGGSWLWVYT